MLPDIADEALFSGDDLVREMRSVDGDPHETWSVKQTHTGRYIVIFRGKNQMVTARYKNLDALWRGDTGDGHYFAIPDDVFAQATYALDALANAMHETVREAFREIHEKVVSRLT